MTSPFVAFRLRQRILWSESEFLGFDDTEDLPTHTKGIIGGSSISRVFLNGDAVARAERSVRIKRKYFPPGSLELRVDEALPRRTLGKTRNFGRHRPRFPIVILCCANESNTVEVATSCVECSAN